MSNDDKFTKTIDDAELDEVAGGTKAETAKDVKFLSSLLGIKIDPKKLNANTLEGNAVSKAWCQVGGIEMIPGHFIAYSKTNIVETKNTYKKGGKEISRNDAMIYAMRKQNKYLNLEDYI